MSHHIASLSLSNHSSRKKSNIPAPTPTDQPATASAALRAASAARAALLSPPLILFEGLTPGDAVLLLLGCVGWLFLLLLLVCVAGANSFLPCKTREGPKLDLCTRPSTSWGALAMTPADSYPHNCQKCATSPCCSGVHKQDCQANGSSISTAELKGQAHRNADNHAAETGNTYNVAGEVHWAAVIDDTTAAAQDCCASRVLLR